MLQNYGLSCHGNSEIPEANVVFPGQLCRIVAPRPIHLGMCTQHPRKKSAWLTENRVYLSTLTLQGCEVRDLTATFECPECRRSSLEWWNAA